tara:strand:+ start:2662 stop:3372 length:711 start_codon:yes stop_codon:yes gene_type:complete
MNRIKKKIKQKIKSILLALTVKYIHKNNILELILDNSEKEALSHVNSGFLFEKGWWESWKTKAPIDLNNNPLPWVTYSFIDFIKDRFKKDMIMFEYGSGNSTFYYSKKVKEVHTVEHDLGWFMKLEKAMPSNVSIKHTKLEYGGDYAKSSLNSGVKYDIVIVDGRDRVNCMINSLNAIKKNGVFILDDSERIAYKKGINELYNNGYKSIDLWGISPGLHYHKCTSIYYKNENILGI